MVCEFRCYSQGSTGVTYAKTDRPGPLKQIPMKLTTQEKQAGLLNESNLNLAIQLFQDEGFVVIEEALPKPWVEDMRAVVNVELESRYAGDEDALDRTRRHGGFGSPMKIPFTDPLIIENSMTFQIVSQVFGKRFFSSLPYGCNTAFPGSSVQNVHRDCGLLFPELQVALPPVLIVVNYSLDEFTAENGATEIWPGSHHTLNDDPEEISTLRVGVERPAHSPSQQTLMPAGSIVVRDMRTWHRGMANTTDKTRTMLSLVYFRPYYLPDNLDVSVGELTDDEWQQFSDRAKQVYRLRRQG
jgi:hypothetical protein